ncbi:29618_t:CDS:2, partial [Racocetra persica]
QDDHSEYPNWDLLSMQLLNTAYYKHPIVLILDQVDRIVKNDPEFLEILRKTVRIGGSLVVIFSASKGLVPQIMKSRSAWSRAAIPFEVGDISDEEAVKFLQNSGIDQKTLKFQYLAGGWFTLLKELQALNHVNSKNLFE